MKYLKIFVLISFILFSVNASAEFYKYTDEDGNVRFTDDINQVPEEQRSKIRSYVESQSEEVPEQETTQESPEKSEQQANVPDSSENEAAEGSLEELKSRIDAIKEEVEQAYAALLKEKEQLSEDKKKVKTREQVENYNKRIESYNIRGQDFIKKQKERDALIDDYNARIMKKNTKEKTQ
jgi:vacuolar-type H+-ATPase subunit I/STV1